MRLYEVPSINDDLFIDAALCVPVFEPLIRCDACLVGIYVEETYSSDVITIPAIPTEACTPAIAHPELRPFLLFIHGEHAIVIGVVAENYG